MAIRFVITIVIKRLTNRVSQVVAVEGDVEAVAVVGGMIAAPKKKFGLKITKNCRATVGTLMESEPKGKVRLSEANLQMVDQSKASQEKMIWEQVSNADSEERTSESDGRSSLWRQSRGSIRRNRELMIAHHAAAVVAVVVDGEHEMAKTIENGGQRSHEERW